MATAIGGNINNRQGFVHEPGLEWSWAELLDATSLDVVELPDLVRSQNDGCRSFEIATAPVVDTSEGWAQYRDRIGKSTSIKTILYKERELRRENL